MAPPSHRSDASSEIDSMPSDYDFDAEQELQNGTSSRKKRKLSPPSDLDSVDENDIDELQEFKGEGQTAPSIVPSEKLSRINVKRKAEMSKVEDIDKTSKKTSNITFSSLNVAPWLISSLAGMAIRRPTGIQAGCIPEILKGRDCIGGSRTGSGKTVAFAVPILQKWAEDPIGIFAVILTPTRELALQIYEQFKAIASAQSLKVVLVTGGADMRAQAIALSQRPHVIVATPGRLADHVRTSGEDTIAGLRRVRFVVLDEADRLLAAGHGSMLPDVEECLSVLPPSEKRQTCLFTATVTPEVRALKDMPRPASKPPLHICEIDTESPAIPSTLQQTYLKAPVTHRESYLHILLLTPRNLPRSTILFCNRTSTASLLEHLLRSLEHRVTSLHSALSQSARTSNLARFRARAARILVATDVAARGLDIPVVDLVINYDVPRDPDTYIHRVGRTARAGRNGESITIVGQRDVELVLAIEQRVGKQMVEWQEEGVNVETRVVRDALKPVGERKREALLAIEEGREVTGRRRKPKVRKLVA